MVDPRDAWVQTIEEHPYASSGDAIAEEMIHQVVHLPTKRMEATLHFVHVLNSRPRGREDH